MDNKLNFIFRKKPLEILIEIGKNEISYSSEISIKTNCTLAHTIRIINKLEELKIINSKKIGRKRELKLTQKGKEICEHINEVIKKI